MSRINWTKDQRAVIGLRGHDMLISAAAGSGKTAVLTERIVSRLFDQTEPVHIDEMLVMTYTESAAQEMKQRIRARLAEVAAGENELLARKAREELIRLPQAQISTIHGFCSSVIRNWFNIIDLEPDFRVLADEGESMMLRNECLEAMLEQEYAEKSPAFIELVQAYGSGRDDRDLMELIRSLHAVAMSFPRPAEWLEESLKYYEIKEGESFDASELAGLIVRQTALTAKEIAGRCETLLHQCLKPGGPYMYEEVIEQEKAFFEDLSVTESWAQMSRMCREFEWGRLPRAKGEDIEPAQKDLCQDERNAIKEQFAKQIVKPFYSFTEEEIKKWLQSAYRQGRELVRLTLLFDAAFTALKRARKVIDFSDMEHLALEILQTKNENGQAVIAMEYRRHFAEVMVDEYQDSNYLQDEILAAVSGGKERHNLFMVGDVKQSIYRFRNARPDLFVRKQRAFELYEPESASLLKRTCILLRQNFRSVPQVLDFVNSLFFRLMGEDIGDIAYDDSAALYQGRTIPEEALSGSCEVWVVPDDKERVRMEAHFVAQRMKAMLDHESVTDKGSGNMRPVRFGDMVILSRSLSNWAEEFYEALTDEGIPVMMPRKSGYFQTLEVGTLLDFLRLIGNEKQDLPLCAVMTSCIGRFTDQEMAAIRAADKKLHYFHEAVHAYLDHPSEEKLGAKVKSFMEMVNSFRIRAPFMPVDRLLTQMMDETGYRHYMEAMPGGVQRRANLMMLIDKARSYARTGYRGLTGFLDYIELMDQNNVDYGEAGLFDEQADVVRMTTIHKSKGLEYPIVFLVGMGRGFNQRDLNSKVLVHPEVGLGLFAWDVNSREKAGTPVRELVRSKLVLDDAGEEMRVLYVACTRAREKLIMTGALRDVCTKEDLCARYHTQEYEGLLPLHTRLQANCYYDWIIPALSGPDGAGSKEPAVLSMADQMALDALKAKDDAMQDRPEQADPQPDRDLTAVIDRHMAYCYPYEEAARVPQKVTVSELKRRQAEQFLKEIGEELYDEPDMDRGLQSVRIRTPKPRLMQGDESMTPAERGTIHHRLLQLLNLSENWDQEKLKKTVDQYCQQGYFDQNEAGVIRTDQILRFLDSDLCRRMSTADQAGLLKREQPFVIGVDASQIDSSWPEGETVLVQGMVDAFFEEKGGLIVVDYKTDKVRNTDELTARYKEQMKWYARALEQLTGKKVTECYLVSLELGQAVTL